MKFFRWVYHHVSYDCWEYKNKECVLTQNYILFGKEKQRVIKNGSEEEYFTHMSGKVIWHSECE